ncbi:methyl-accepting chemotaxis protein [Paenibacillus sp. CCS19]|uniref:methyl-accepting chemotaxis protein n=1 Tax=Paenibacillus sp. CCS19 TaxID=3158387 RepID=UPI00256205EE|nr:methyl-accepting chemotaxis protein [Paenibacillus cellulosilyticus]GMK38317.1 methyl-accepting chemotaxis protein [Paenibacillus cellulosilyticus]
MLGKLKKAKSKTFPKKTKAHSYKTETKPKAAQVKTESNKAGSNSPKHRMNWINPFKSVGTTLFLFIFISIIACVLSVGIAAYNTSTDIVRDYAASTSQETIVQGAGKMDSVFEQYSAAAQMFMTDPGFQQEIRTLRSSKDDGEKAQAGRMIDDRVIAFWKNNPAISRIFIIPTDDKGSMITNGEKFGASYIEKARQYDWYSKALDAKGKEVWIESPLDGFYDIPIDPSIGVAFAMKGTISSIPQYVMLIELKLSAVKEKLGQVSLGDNSHIVIVNKSNQMVIPEDLSQYGQPSSVQLPAELTDRGVFETTTTDGEEVLAVHSKFTMSEWRMVGTLPVDELLNGADRIYRFTVIVTIIAAGVAALLGLLVVLLIARPLGRLRNLMNEGERGNLMVRMKLKRRDEIGQVAQSFNSMMAEITNLVQQTSDSAQEVLQTAAELTASSHKTAGSAKEIAVATEEIAGGATSLAVEAERGNDLTTTIHEQMRKVLDANKQMELAAVQVEQAGQQGSEYMMKLIQKTGMTEEMTRDMVGKVDKLRDSTSSIRKILDVLNNLTKQTNILSLNATIEAARAGSAGKGFMVVADEIRKLADQSRQSIDVVAQITETIQLQIDETVNVLSNAYPLFQEQIASVKESNQIFLTVQGQMGMFAGSMEAVTNAIATLEQSQIVLAEAMSNVSAVAEQSSATSEEVASLSSEQLNISDGLVQLSARLEEVSSHLKQSLSRFNV